MTLAYPINDRNNDHSIVNLFDCSMHIIRDQKILHISENLQNLHYFVYWLHLFFGYYTLVREWTCSKFACTSLHILTVRRIVFLSSVESFLCMCVTMLKLTNTFCNKTDKLLDMKLRWKLSVHYVTCTLKW